MRVLTIVPALAFLAAFGAAGPVAVVEQRADSCALETAGCAFAKIGRRQCRQYRSDKDKFSYCSQALNDVCSKLVRS